MNERDLVLQLQEKIKRDFSKYWKDEMEIQEEIIYEMTRALVHRNFKVLQELCCFYIENEKEHEFVLGKLREIAEVS